MKFALIRFLDLSGMTFLTPIVRLLYGEEPRTQWKKIGQFIVIPVMSILAFLVLWSQIAPRHKTKSGEVPTPSVVWNAAVGIWEFHVRENDKQQAFELTGDSRTSRGAEIDERLKVLDSLAAEADKQVAAAESAMSSHLAAQIVGLQKKSAVEIAELKAQSLSRLTNLQKLASDKNRKLVDIARILITSEEAMSS